MAIEVDVPIENGVAVPVRMEDRPKVYGWSTINEKSYIIDEVPSGIKRPKKIIVVGVGASGLDFVKF